MISNTSNTSDHSPDQLAFADYIAQCRRLIQDRRACDEKILNANSPFEFTPTTMQTPTIGALLIHGLFDCPFSMRDIGNTLAANQVLTRSILLPGHGTTPKDLLHVTYQEWIDAVRYGVESLKKSVDKIFLVGYSMGGALSVHHALNDPSIAGLVLLAPAIKVKAPVDIVVNWHKFLSIVSKNKEWVYIEDEIDYTKYQSIAFNPIDQISKLIESTNIILENKSLNCPIFMALSQQDETISSKMAIEFFTNSSNPRNHLLLYTSDNEQFTDKRIVTRTTEYPALHIKHFSHSSIMFNENNPHYGEHGDFSHASLIDKQDYVYGAYNHLEVSAFNLLYDLGIIQKRRRELTYNPDFPFMAEQIAKFITT